MILRFVFSVFFISLQLCALEQIENNLIKVQWDGTSRVYKFISKANSTTFGESEAQAGGASTAVVDNSYLNPDFGDDFGTAKRLIRSNANGNEESFTIYPNNPFVFMSIIMKNDTNAEIRVNRQNQLSMKTIGAFQGSATVNWIGTKNSWLADYNITDDDWTSRGSYHFMVLGDPDTRQGVVASYLTHTRGSGIVGYHPSSNPGKIIESRVDYGRLMIPANSQEESEVLLFGYFDDVRLGLEKSADLSADVYDVVLKPKANAYCTWYGGSGHSGASDKDQLPGLAQSIKDKLAPYDFKYLQLDDRWQIPTDRTGSQGPYKNFSGADSSGPYPSSLQPDGMTWASNEITNRSLESGIWFIPFGGDAEDSYFSDKQDLFLRDTNGNVDNAGFAGNVFDLTHPSAQAFVKDHGSRIRGWGYTYFKMDGFYAGMGVKELGDSAGYNPRDNMGLHPVYDPSITPVEAFRLGISKVREGAGDDVYFLACNAGQNQRILGASFGLVDAFRVGGDREAANIVGINGQADRGFWEGTSRYFLNGRMWYSDPDPIYTASPQSLANAQFQASWAALSQTLYVPGNWIPELPEARLEVLRRTLPLREGGVTRPVDYLEQYHSRLWLWQAQEDSDKGVVGIYNFDVDNGLDVNYSIAKLGLDTSKTYIAHDFWSDTLVGPINNTLNSNVALGESQILSMRPIEIFPIVLNTSAHLLPTISQVNAEAWDAGAQRLSSEQYIVANDPCELRIYVPGNADNWTVADIVTNGPSAAGTSFVKDGNLIRVTISPTATGLYTWSVTFGALQNPLVNIQSNLAQAYPLADVTFDARASLPSDSASIATYGWDFDNDGTVDLEETTGLISHQYVGLGVKTIRVVVTDDANKTADGTMNIEIIEVPESPNVVISNGLVGWWPLDETSGSLAKDLSPTGEDGDLVGSPLNSQAGKVDKSVRFNSSDDHILLHNNSNVVYDIAGGKFSISAWIKPAVYPNTWNGIVGSPNGGLSLGVKSGTLQMGILGVADLPGSGTSIPTGQWTHVIGCFDNTSTSNNVKYYVNGALVKTASSSAMPLSPRGLSTIGRFWDNTTTSFDGNIDEVRIYNRILSNNEATSIHAYLGGSVNRAPYNILIDETRIELPRSNNDLVATLSGVDPDQGDTLAYSLLNDSNGRFSLVNDKIYIADTSALIAGTTYTIQVRVMDQEGADFTKNIDFRVLSNSSVTHTVIANAVANGTISPNGAVSVNDGASQVFNFTPATGYRVAQVIVGNQTIQTNSNSYTIQNVTAATTIDVSFEAIPTYKVNSSSDSNGSISPSTEQIVSENGSQAYTFTPATGYQVDEVRVDSQLVQSSNNVYTIQNITADTTISVSFEIAPQVTGLVVHYPFDESTGTTAVDASGSGNNGALSGTAAWASGHANGSLEFDASKDGAAGVTIANGASIFGAMGSEIAFSFWTYDDGTQIDSQQVVFFANQKQVGSSEKFAIYLFAGNGKVEVESNGITHNVTVTEANYQNKWVHWAVSKDATTLKIYADGAEIYSGADTTTISSNVDLLTIGGIHELWQSKTWYPYPGKIDDFRIYDTALTVANVLNLYNGTVAPSNNAPVIANFTVPATAETSVNINISATATDADTDPMIYAWSQVSGSGTASFANANALSTTVSFNQAGTYELKLVVSDSVDSAEQTATVIVSDPVASTYTVTYEDNGADLGTAPDDSATYASGATATVLGQSDMLETGHAFNGWNAAVDGSGIAYAVGDTLAITANTTLFAQWAPYVKEFNLKSGYNYISYNGASPIDAALAFKPLMDTGQLEFVRSFDVTLGRSSYLKERYSGRQQTFYWDNGIGNLTNGQAYIVNVNVDVNLIIPVIQAQAPMVYNLKAGYNYAGYNGSGIVDAQAALQPLIDSGKLEFVRTFDLTSGRSTYLKERYSGRQQAFYWDNGIGDLIDGQGYIINLNADHNGFEWVPVP